MWVLCACKGQVHTEYIPSAREYGQTGMPTHGGSKLRARYGDVAVRDLRNRTMHDHACELLQSTAEELRDEPGKRQNNVRVVVSLLDCAYTSPSRRLSGDRAAPASAAAHIGSARGRTCTRKRVRN